MDSGNVVKINIILCTNVILSGGTAFSCELYNEGVMVSMLDSSVLYFGFETWSRLYKIIKLVYTTSLTSMQH